MNQIVCLADHPWSPVPARIPQLLARLRDAQILYFEPAGRACPARQNSARRVRPNILAYTLPCPSGSDDIYSLRRRLARRKTADFIHSKLRLHGFRDPVLWVTHPRQAIFLDLLAYRGLVYDCAAFHPSSMGEQEGALAQAADVIFAASPGLMDRLSPCNSNIALIPNGVNYTMFCRTDLEVPPVLAGIGGPVLGRLGEITPELNLAPAEHTAKEHPEWTLVLAGKAEGNPRLASLRQLPNVLLTGPVPMTDLPDYLGRFDVCLHLLKAGDEDTDVIPSRIYEYLSTGKPIVSMLCEDQVEIFPDVIYGAHTPQEFSLLCARALTEHPEWVSKRRRGYGQAAAWTARAAEVIHILESIGLY